MFILITFLLTVISMKNHILKTLCGSNFEMDCAVFGTGSKPLVILPGMSLHPVTPTAGSVAASFACFSQDYTVYLFDRKKDIRPGYMVEDMADDTLAAMDMLGIGMADFYGASQGGMMAMSIASRFPSRVRKLVLASTSPHSTPEGKLTMYVWEKLASEGDAVKLNREIFSRVYSPEFQQRYANAFKALEKNGTPEEMRSFVLLAQAARAFDMGSSLEDISCPVFVIGVENDTVLGSDGVREIAERLHCPLKLYPGSGHACYDEDRKFPALIKDFFDSQS